MKKKKRPRLAWFALDADAFLDDERTQVLTNREQGAWLLMLVKAFRRKGCIVGNLDIISEQTGLDKKESRVILDKLTQENLLIETGKQGEYYSPRLDKEIKTAKASYERFSNMGASSAKKNGTNNLRLIK